MRFSSRGRTVPVPRPPCCLNCGASVPAAAVFCGACGQENEATPVSFVALLREAWDEFVKIDAKLLVTLRLLLTRPGFLSTEYVRGRRVAYLSPFKMYLAVSALFFLVWGFVVPFDTVRTQIAAAEKSAKIAAVQSKGAAKTAKTGSDPGASSFRYKLLSVVSSNRLNNPKMVV